MTTSRLAPIAFGAALALACACEPLPSRFPRVTEAVPTGTVAADARIAFTASEPLDREGLVGGGRVALCRAEDLRDVKQLAEDGEAADAAEEGALPARVELVNGGRTVVVEPRDPLVPGTAYAAVLAHGVRAADGRLVLDAEGRPRSVVVEFTVSTQLAGPVVAALTKVLADAETPEAGGEYVEVTNLGPEPLDLAGFRLAKRGPTGSFTRCVVERRSGIGIPARGRGLVAGGAYDGRYATPAHAPVYACGASAVAGGLANDRAPALVLEDPAGSVVSTLGIVAAAPRCGAAALVRLDEAGPDAAANLGCDEVVWPASVGTAPPAGPATP